MNLASPRTRPQWTGWSWAPQRARATRRGRRLRSGQTSWGSRGVAKGEQQLRLWREPGHLCAEHHVTTLASPRTRPQWTNPRRARATWRQRRLRRGQQRRGKNQATYASQQHRGIKNVREDSEVAMHRRSHPWRGAKTTVIPMCASYPCAECSALLNPRRKEDQRMKWAPFASDTGARSPKQP